MKKRIIAVLLTGVMMLSLAGCGGKTESSAGETKDGVSTESTETVELKLGHPLGPGTSQHIYLEKWAEAVAEASNGKYQITIYPSSQFGKLENLWSPFPMAFIILVG